MSACMSPPQRGAGNPDYGQKVLMAPGFHLDLIVGLTCSFHLVGIGCHDGINNSESG